MTRKEYRAETRRKHGPDWWKTKAKKVIPYEKKWAGFPVRVGGMEDSSLLHPEDGDDIYKGDLVYDDSDQVGEYHWGVTVKKKGSKYTIIGSASAPYAGGGSEEILLSGASRAEAIQYLKGLKDYDGPDEE